MTIFNFLKETGEKLFGHDPKSTTATTTATPQQHTEKLQQHLQSLNLGVDNAKVSVQGDTAVVEGHAASQEMLEKAILAIGNVAGIAKVESRLQTANTTTTAAQSQFYTVKDGDTLSKIAKEFYGDANQYNAIFEANRPMLKTADAIYVGQQLRIPQNSSKAA